MSEELRERATGGIGLGSTRDEFGRVVRAYQDAAFAYAYALLRDRETAEDAVQASFLTAWLHRGDLVQPNAFAAWLRKIVRTECHRITRRQRLATVPFDDVEAIAEHVNRDESPAWELRQVILKAIGGFPERDRVIISLRYTSDFSYEDISAFLGVPVTTVKKRLHDARTRLRTTLEKLGEFTERVLRERRPSNDLHLETRIMTATDFLEKIMI